MRALQALPMPLESTTDSAAISPLASAAADGAARATEDSSPPAAPGRLTASAMEKSGSDLHSQSSTQHLRQLSCISEHPSPDQPQTTQPTAAPPPPSTKVVLPTDATSTHARKIDDAADAKPPSVVPLPTPKLGPGLAATTTQRPFHIPISTLSPSAALVSPSAANLSPNVAYTSTGTTAPSSPLARNSSTASNSASRPTGPIRRQSLISNRQSTLIQTLLRGSQADDAGGNSDQLLPISGNMVTRKIWVKRPNASATLVTINEDDLVDDVRDMILRKYANSLGRQFDAPDLTIRIRPTGNLQDRMLGPEEPMSRTLDAYYPGGQTVDDALIIDVPQRRTPRASPRAGPPHAPHMQYYEDTRPSEAGNDYFGPGALTAHVPVTVTAPSNGSAPAHAISILQTGHLPQLPSPGGTRSRNYRERPERPRLGRQHTSSPTLINMASGAPHQGSMAAAAAPHDQPQATTAPPPMSTPPAPESTAIPQRVATPPPRVSSPRPKAQKKSKKNTDHPSLPKGMLNGSVPPINVLIVEDNIINLKLLEAFVKRLKVRWQTAMNGRDAVTKWRGGGFHLVLMDIQLPVMSGLDATREIRRLERVNSIGVFSSAASAAPEVKAEPAEKDKLENMHLFRSPVIIVALTASSLQSDRHEALAAGCNDFLTKPVNFVWLERKVMEWGCMQALIDFDGWRKWKDFSQKLEDDKKTAAAVSAQKARTKKNRSSLTQAVTAGA
ncbi:Response regulator mcs4 [Cytospora mali]|uniref:Response regulator mcs4 n=1 Tax=Cytospora mali TaxID=578113 RepID=A0A194VJH7_CYTMA|nr:Response regulator mcs4 [Valsa mali]